MSQPIKRSQGEPFYAVGAVQAWEQRWFAQGNISFGLMQQAAWQIANWIMTHLTQQAVTVVCGTGNNGGDGWLVADYLQQAGWLVRVVYIDQPTTADAQAAQTKALSADVLSQVWQLDQGISLQAEPGLIVDALFGIGLNRAPNPAYAALIDWMNQQPAQRIAIDIPSGLNAQTGHCPGAVVQADITLCVLGLKPGLLTGGGRDCTGRLVTLPLIPPDAALLVAGQVCSQAPQLPKRQQDSHKGSFGHVVLVGGGPGMGGAGLLAAWAALVAGAGKVTLVTHHAHVTAITAHTPELMTYALPDDISSGLFDPASTLGELLSQADVLVVGMGLGRHAWGQQVWQGIQPYLAATSVIDADGLYHLAQETKANSLQPADASYRALPIWYTPHPGEAMKLFQAIDHTAETPDRFTLVQCLQQHFGGEWLLKGSGSLVQTAAECQICQLGNPAMATAGMGDVLAGLAGALRAQFSDATLMDAVLIHAMAGDQALLTQAELLNQTDLLKGGRGITASQVVQCIPHVMLAQTQFNSPKY